jgi:hypothetical protein
VGKPQHDAIFLTLQYLMSCILLKQANAENAEHQVWMAACNVIAHAAVNLNSDIVHIVQGM